MRDKAHSGVELNPDERSILNTFLYLAYRNGDLAYLQYQRGIIDVPRLRSGLGLLMNYLRLPIVQAHWQAAKAGFVEPYQNYVDQLIEEVNSERAVTDESET